MSAEPSRTSGGSWALQGCLFGAVALFVLLLLFMIFLAYRRFQENTQPTPAETGAEWIAPAELVTHA